MNELRCVCTDSPVRLSSSCVSLRISSIISCSTKDWPFFSQVQAIEGSEWLYIIWDQPQVGLFLYKGTDVDKWNIRTISSLMVFCCHCSPICFASRHNCLRKNIYVKTIWVVAASSGITWIWLRCTSHICSLKCHKLICCLAINCTK
jgi:hypothetical protein